MCKKEIEQYEDNLRNLCFPVEFKREFTYVPSFMERYPLETLSRSKTNNFFFTSKVYSIERRRVSSAARTAKKAIGIQPFQKRLSERLANGECRTEVARPKGTVLTLFDMQNFISYIHLA